MGRILGLLFLTACIGCVDLSEIDVGTDESLRVLFEVNRERWHNPFPHLAIAATDASAVLPSAGVRSSTPPPFGAAPPFAGVKRQFDNVSLGSMIELGQGQFQGRISARLASAARRIEGDGFRDLNLIEDNVQAITEMETRADDAGHGRIISALSPVLTVPPRAALSPNPTPTLVVDRLQVLVVREGETVSSSCWSMSGAADCAWRKPPELASLSLQPGDRLDIEAEITTHVPPTDPPLGNPANDASLGAPWASTHPDAWFGSSVGVLLHSSGLTLTDERGVSSASQGRVHPLRGGQMLTPDLNTPLAGSFQGSWTVAQAESGWHFLSIELADSLLLSARDVTLDAIPRWAFVSIPVQVE